MKTCLFLTDRFPYGKGESFIENEIPYLEKYFDSIYILPLGLCVNTDEKRTLSEKFIVLPPANTDDLYRNGRPSTIKRIIWSLQHMVLWVALTFFSGMFWSDIGNLCVEKKISLSTVKSSVRYIAPIQRNVIYFRNQLKKFDFFNDDIYIYAYWANAFVCKIGQMIESKRKPLVVCRAHRTDLYSERHSSGYIPLRKQLLESIDNMYLISMDGLDYMRHHYPKYTDKYILSYLGTKDYGVEVYTREGRPFRLLSCSFVIPVKRVNRIIDALVDFDDEIEWMHFGGGQDLVETKRYAEKMLGDKANITYKFYGHVSNCELMQHYKENCYDVFVNVSESEGLPVSIMEALSFGIPIIATDVGSTRETIRINKNGYLLKKDFSTSELKEAIKIIIQKDEDAYLLMRKQSRQLWEERFYSDKNYTEFIEKLLNSDRKAEE